VLYITGDISPTFEGLRITDGDAAGLGGVSFGDAGGGVYAITATVTLSNSQVFSNTALIGGGLTMYYSDATVVSNTVSSNSANWGGGLNLWYSDDVMINNNIILSNTARNANGGGLHFFNSSRAMLAANIISGNGAANGGGLYFGSSPGATLNSNTIMSNTASGWGNTNVGGGLYFGSSDNVTLTDNVIRDNWGRDYGGGLAFWICDNIELAANFTADNSSRRGGGLSVDNSDVNMTNNVIADNRADLAGSGLYNLDSSLQMLHTTIARNGGGDGSGAYIAGTLSNVTMTNTILVSHSVGITVAAGNTATLECTLWGTGAWANDTDWGGAGTIITGTCNYWGDPAFLDPDAGDYHIGSGSAAIDVGVDAGVDHDIDGDSRDAMPDLGADKRAGTGIYLPIILKDG
jgi:hypothetical protein